MNFGRIAKENLPSTSSVLRIDYQIVDSKEDHFSRRFPLDKHETLLVNNEKGSIYTYLTIGKSAPESWLENPEINPSPDYLSQHRQLEDIVDLAVCFCMGQSVLYPPKETIVQPPIHDDFEEKFNELRQQQGLPPSYFVSAGFGMPVSINGSTNSTKIEQMADVARQCLTNEKKRAILDIYRDGRLYGKIKVELWHKMYDYFDKNCAEYSNLSESDLEFLKWYPQKYRHSGNRKKPYLEAEKKFPEEFHDSMKGLPKYVKLWTRILKSHFGISKA